MNRFGFMLFVAVIIAGYLIVSLFTGSRSIFRLPEMDREIGVLEEELAKRREINAELSDRLRRLDPATIDLDFLEETIKRSIGIGLPGEWLVPMSELDRTNRTKSREDDHAN